MASEIKMNISDSNGINRANTLGLFFFQSMQRYKNNISQYVADSDTINTYGELLIRSIRVALKLRDKGIDKNDIISTCSPNQENSCVPTIAAQFLGAKSANLDPNLSHLDTIRLLDLIRPRIIFVSQNSLSLIEKCLAKANLEAEIVVFENSDKYVQFSDYLVPHSQEDTFEPDSSGDDKETAAIMFSSGSTGYPKGICLSHYSILKSISTIAEYIPEQNRKKKSSVLLTYSNLYWISALGFLVRSMSSGLARVVCSQFNAASLWKLIEKYKINSIFLPPYQAVEFLDQRPDDAATTSLELFVTGSCNVTKKLMEDLKSALPNTTIMHSYGQTEGAGLITMFVVSKPEDIELQNRKPLSCGKILPGYKWKVVDIDTEEPLGPNQEGELRIKSASLMNGYHKMDSSSVYDEDGYLKTGDIAYFDEEECFYIVGRLKEIFKYRGWHILPAMLEEILLTHPAVKEAAVIGIPHEIDGEHPAAIVVLYDGHDDVTAEDIQLFFDKRVSDCQKLRGGVRIVKDIMRTTTGKIQRRSLKQFILNGEH